MRPGGAYVGFGHRSMLAALGRGNLVTDKHPLGINNGPIPTVFFVTSKTAVTMSSRTLSTQLDLQVARR